MNKYFVSYFYETKGKIYGCGRTIFETDKKINDRTIFSEIESKIAKIEGFDSVVIINYIKL